ncbi:MAG TPA: hypothetical protein VHE78_11670 [Gemmatimonadaceae bacterium]|nr:hypothetical protein [Gemmatimonadaceae bacterium]
MLLGALLAPALARSQSPGGLGSDARVLPWGAVSILTGMEWARVSERYARNPPGRKNGALEPLGQDFNLDTLGSAQLEYLSPLEAAVRSLAAMPAFNASLGRMVVHVRDRVLTTPFAFDVGLTGRLTVGVVLPLVTATSEVDFRMNPTGREPTVAFNPTLAATAAVAANASLLAQFDSAAAQLGRQLASCPANPSQPGCAAVNANPAGARGLLQNAGAFADGLAQVYGGRNGAKGALFVPIFGTAAQSAIEARVSGYKALYATFGAGAITSNGPVAAQAPLTADDAQRVFTDPMFGVRAQPLATTVARGLGDMEISAKLKLVDTFGGDLRNSFAPAGFNWRQSVGAGYRLATGVLNAPDNFTDIGTGRHSRATEARSFTDLLFGPHFWLSVVAQYNMPMADERVVRITDSPDQPLPAAYRQQTVKRKLGNELDIAVNPRWTLNEYMSLSGHYYYRSKSADAYTGTFRVANLAGEQVMIDASTLDIATEAREHRLGLGVSFSTVAAFERGTAAFPIEIAYSHFQTTLGSLGDVPKFAVDLMQVRVYGRLFGR